MRVATPQSVSSRQDEKYRATGARLNNFANKPELTS